MKKSILTVLSGLAIFLSVKYADAQSSFQFDIHDTLVKCAPKALGDTSCHGNMVRNKTAQQLTILAVRLQDVNLATGWESAMCLGLCFPPPVDTIKYLLPASDSIEFIPHFYYTTSPDSQTILIKILDSANTADFVLQRFYGITEIGFSVHEYASLAAVKMFPSPAVYGQSFVLNISQLKYKAEEISLLVYDVRGKLTATLTGLHPGNNNLTLNLPAGLYSYHLASKEVVLKSGKLSVMK